MMKSQELYPFIPKSTAHLRRGQFWPIALESGRYGAGCVVGEALYGGVRNTRVFIAGVLQWIGDTHPTAQSLSRLRLYKFGFLHIKSINESGLPIVGEADIEFNDAPSSAESLELTTWGYQFPLALCERLLSSQTL
jgi:hypothetical protein